MATKTSTFQVRINPKTKKAVEKIVSSLGITMSDAVTMYFEQIQTTKTLPLTLGVSDTVVLTNREEKEVQKSLASGWANNSDIARLLQD